MEEDAIASTSMLSDARPDVLTGASTFCRAHTSREYAEGLVDVSGSVIEGGRPPHVPLLMVPMPRSFVAASVANCCEARGLLRGGRQDDGIMAVSAQGEEDPVEFQPMSPDEMHRMMQFLLQQQAQFSADLAQMSQEFAKRFEETDRRTGHVTDALLGLTGIVGQLASAQLRTDEQLKELRGQLGETNTYIQTVESHLNALIEMFERHLREDHGHRPS